MSMGRPRNGLTARVLAPVEASWLGAYIEADGAVCWNANRHAKAGGCWWINVTARDVEMVATCLRLAGCGSVYLKRTPAGEDCWQWIVAAHNDVHSLARQLYPYCVKVRKI